MPQSCHVGRFDTDGDDNSKSLPLPGSNIHDNLNGSVGRSFEDYEAEVKAGKRGLTNNDIGLG